MIFYSDSLHSVNLTSINVRVANDVGNTEDLDKRGKDVHPELGATIKTFDTVDDEDAAANGKRQLNRLSIQSV